MTAHVLVVDDDLDIREALAEILEEHGVTVTTAIHGEDALAKLREGPRPNLILLDLMMPVLDGRGFCERLRVGGELAELAIVLLSADREIEAIARELGAATCLPKPVDLARLIDAVDRYSRPD